MRKLLSLSVLAFVPLLADAADSFLGWQGMRVIRTPFGAGKIEPIQLEADGRTALLLVNTRQSRLELYRHRGTSETPVEPVAPNLDDPNFLPMAEDFERLTLSTPRLPLFATSADLKGDGREAIFYVQEDPRELVLLERDDIDGASPSWQPTRRWEIATSDLTTPTPLISRITPDGPQVLLSYRDGIQIVDLTKDTVEWLQPRERLISRSRWWLADLDGDGDADLVESTDSTANPVRWYEADGSSFRPAVEIAEGITRTNLARLIRTPEGPAMAFLGANQANTISLYRIGEGKASPLGRRHLLPLSQPDPKFWASLTLEGSPAIVELGLGKPLLNLFRQKNGFWDFVDAFPLLDGVETVKSLRSPEPALFFQVKDESRIYRSVWRDGRFSFPQPFPASPDSAAPPTADRLLAFDQHGDTLWWIQRHGQSLILSTLGPGNEEPKITTFPDLPGDYESAIWLGAESLLVKKRFSQETELCQLVDGLPQLSPTRLRAGDLPRLMPFQDVIFLPKDGGVQILDRRLQPIDQILLDGDRTIRSFAPSGEGTAYALEDDNRFLAFLEADESGLYRTVKRLEIPTAQQVRDDPVLGLSLVSHASINLPGPGRPTQLVLETTYDPAEEGLRTHRETTFSNLFPVDLDGDGFDEIAAIDQSRRTVTVYQYSHEEGFSEMISWKVFDDEKYPYGRDSGQGGGSNPYRMLAFDLDGDGLQDLVLASHDRLLFYLARDPSSDSSR